MTFAYWCLPILVFLPLIWVGMAKVNGSGYDNDRPRVWLEKQQGRAQRANWAQQNAYEAFPPFAVGVIVAHLTGSDQATIDMLAGLFVIVRIAHGFAYIYDRSTLRTLFWVVGFGATIALFVT